MGIFDTTFLKVSVIFLFLNCHLILSFFYAASMKWNRDQIIEEYFDKLARMKLISLSEMLIVQFLFEIPPRGGIN